MSAIPKSSHFASLGPAKCILKYQSLKIHKQLQKVPQTVILGTPICLQFGHYFALGRPPGPLDSLVVLQGDPRPLKVTKIEPRTPLKCNFSVVFQLKKLCFWTCKKCRVAMPVVPASPANPASHQFAGLLKGAGGRGVSLKIINIPLTPIALRRAYW